MTATINVNLAGCITAHTCRAGHKHPCAAVPIPINCPIPRSVTFTVRFGECECIYPALAKPPVDPHRKTCPARPIRVSCSVSGKTWEESEVTDVDNPRDPQGRWGAGLGDTWRHVVRECNDRWAFIKALVTGGRALSVMDIGWEASDRFIAQRDAVFAAIADMARAEEATCIARDAVRKARNLPKSRHLVPELRESAIELGDYVERLIERVGNPEGGQ